jgi:hypothetical protein
MITHELLRELRNDLPMSDTLRQLGRKAPYSKWQDGRQRFICHHCGELYAVINPKNNLAHCFHCRKNTNNIDLVLQAGYAFVDAVALLQEWLGYHREDQANPTLWLGLPPLKPVEKPSPEAESIGAILRQETGKR